MLVYQFKRAVDKNCIVGMQDKGNGTNCLNKNWALIFHMIKVYGGPWKE